MAHQALKSRVRADYAFHLDYRLRWLDNDIYSHLNNTIYTQLFDSIVNSYLSQHCGRNPRTSPEIGIIVTAWSHYFGSISYPSIADCGLRVNALGKTSVQYEIGVFERGSEEVRVVGGFTHVFCERVGGAGDDGANGGGGRGEFRTKKDGMCMEVRSGLERILLGRDWDGDNRIEGGSEDARNGGMARGGGIKALL